MVLEHGVQNGCLTLDESSTTVTLSSNSKEVNEKLNHLDMEKTPQKDIFLDVDPHRHNYGRRATLCENIFGIVPGQFGGKFAETNGKKPDRRIMVHGLTPGGEAMKDGRIKFGDWLMQINELDVTLDNLDLILSAITGPRRIKLTLQKFATQNVPKPAAIRKPSMNDAESLVQLVQGERVNSFKPELHRLPHVVLYLTMDVGSEAMHNKEDVVYQFPKRDSKLLDVRGMFLTLSHMLSDVTGSPARNSTMCVGEELVHVGYVKEGREVLVVALPAARVPLLVLNHLMECISRLLRLLYGSLKSAFSPHDNHPRLDHYFHLLLQRVVFREEMLSHGLQLADGCEPFLSHLEGARGIILPDEVKVSVNNCLNEFEAADFYDMSEDYYDMRRAFTIVGSCLFYKGYLLANHLNTADLEDISLYVESNMLLTMSHSEQLGHQVAWTEVFPTRRCHSVIEPLIPGYTEPEARWFILVVKMENLLLCTLLEAGGCAQWADGHPTTDPFYLDQAKGVLQQILSTDLIVQLEYRLESACVPSLASPSWFIKGTKAEDGKPKVPGSPTSGATPGKKGAESFMKKKPSPHQEKYRQHGRGAVYEMDSDGDGGTEASNSPMKRQLSVTSDDSAESVGSSSLFKGPRRRRNLPSVSDGKLQRKESSEWTLEQGNHVKLTSGCENTLFQYVQFDQMEGVYICPTQQDLLRVNSSLNSQVLRNFQQACIHIRSLLRGSKKKKASVSNNDQQDQVTEHGILFEYKPENTSEVKKQGPPMMYWVIGRVFPEPYPRELYVCFQDSSQQNMVDLAFKLGFGVTL